MRLTRLLLSDYRNFPSLDLRLSPGPSIFVGDNAQGKTNLLEAIYLLSAMRTPRVQTESQLIRWQALSSGGQTSGLPDSSLISPSSPNGTYGVARAVGELETLRGSLSVEVTVMSREGNNGRLLSGKTVRINGLPRRLIDAVGRVNAVLFTADDLDLVKGPPALRRRYLDLTISQVDAAYLGARQRYEKILLQRNHLLKRIRERQAGPEELAFWDQELAKEGAYIIWARARATAALAKLASAAHALLAPDEELCLQYQPRLPSEEELSPLDQSDPSAVSEAFLRAQRQQFAHEVAAGMTLVGPHRDDIIFLLNGIPAIASASRAQQRTMALALRLAEARYLLANSGESPILLLDDVLSEMDAHRRRCVLEALTDYEQVLITATDLDRFSTDFFGRAALYEVVAGSIIPKGQLTSVKKEDA